MSHRSLCALALLFLAGVTVSAQTPSEKPSLDGVWEITAMIDDGRLIGPQTIHEQFVRYRRITIAGQTLTVNVPGLAQPKTIIFVADFTQTPYTFDLAGTEKTGNKGIFITAGDTLMICLSDRDSPQRPTGFVSTPQSKTLLLTLQRVKVPTAYTPEPKVVEPIKPVPVHDLPDEATRKQLTGTWGHQTKDTIDYVTLNADGSMSATRTWKSAFKRAFHDDVRSSGDWKVQDGVVIVHVTTSTDKELRGQVYSYRIRTLTDKEVIAVDQSGQVRREWKVQ
jgi:uncharacterized protein (TIGR03067 family)